MEPKGSPAKSATTHVTVIMSVVGSKLNHQGTTGFGPLVPFTRATHLGYPFLTHSQMNITPQEKNDWIFAKDYRFGGKPAMRKKQGLQLTMN